MTTSETSAPDAEMPSERHVEIALLTAIASLLADERQARLTPESTTRKPVGTDVLLADAGVDFTTIASILGKKRDAVRMSVTRARRQKAEQDK